MNQKQRALKVDQYLLNCGVNTMSRLEEQEYSYFSDWGCDCCSPGLGNNVYEVVGYDSEENEVVTVGEVCHECLCISANGIE